MAYRYSSRAFGAAGEPVGVGGVAYVAHNGVPGAGWHAGTAAFPADVLDQVIGGGVTGDLPHADSGGGEGRRGAVQLAGGIGQGLFEPGAGFLCLLLADALARRGGTQKVHAERSLGAEPGCV